MTDNQTEGIAYRSGGVWTSFLVRLSADAHMAVWLDLAHRALGLSTDDCRDLRDARRVSDHGIARPTPTSQSYLVHCLVQPRPCCDHEYPVL
jgi:hypothetical protein